MYFSGINAIKMGLTDFDMFWKFYPAAATRILYFKIMRRKLRNPIYAGHRVLSQNRGNETLKKLINSGKPFMFGRHGSNELFIAGYAMMKEKRIIDKIDYKKLELPSDQCGLFPLNDETIKEFYHLLKYSSSQCDLYGTFRMLWEDYFIKHFMPDNVILTHLNMMDFWRYDEPFSSALVGKKVLVVHPLAKEIESQYARRELIFKNPTWLPEFELHTITAVQSIAKNRDQRFSTWFEGLEYLVERTKDFNFDIALLGCGAYGMPLAAKIKEQGKQAIYMGGVLQMLFGIRGKRWDAIPGAASLYNNDWISPPVESIPRNAVIVEKGCYW